MYAAPDPRLDSLVERLDHLERRHRQQRRWLFGSIVALVTLLSSTLHAQVTWAPPGFNVFAPDTPALASEVNQNFQWLVQNPGAVFLTTGACPAGYTAYEGGQYLRLGTPNLAPVARTLSIPAHQHQDLGGLVITGALTRTRTMIGTGKTRAMTRSTARRTETTSDSASTSHAPSRRAAPTRTRRRAESGRRLAPTVTRPSPSPASCST